MLAHQTSEVQVLSLYPASPTMILMRCRIIVNNVEKSQVREGNLPLGQKKIFKNNKNKNNKMFFIGMERNEAYITNTQLNTFGSPVQTLLTQISQVINVSKSLCSNIA